MKPFPEVLSPFQPSTVQLPLTAFIVILAALLAVWSLKRQLPAHNVLMACVVAGGWFWAMESLNARHELPFGAGTTLAGPCLPGGASLLAVLFWVAALFGSRALARRLLQPWREARCYGYALTGLAVLLVLVLNHAVEPVGRGAPEQFWLRQLTSAGAVLAALVAVFPWLIVKRPGPPPPEAWGAVTWFLLWSSLTGVHWTEWIPWPTLAVALLAAAAFLAKPRQNGGSCLPPSQPP